MDDRTFRAAGYDWRLYCGANAIETGLKESVERVRAKRAFVICSPSVNQRTDTVRRIAATLGTLYAGVFDGIEKDSTYESVCGAVAAVGLDDLAGFLADAAKEFPAVRLHGGVGVIDALLRHCRRRYSGRQGRWRAADLAG